jgi:hypothetical protein
LTVAEAAAPRLRRANLSVEQNRYQFRDQVMRGTPGLRRPCRRKSRTARGRFHSPPRRIVSLGHSVRHEVGSGIARETGMSLPRSWFRTTYVRRPNRHADPHGGPPSPSTPVWCVKCGAVFANKRWSRRPARLHGVRAAAAAQLTICPACRMVASGGFHGQLQLSGAFLGSHHDDIVHLLENEAQRAAEVNPLGRIAAWMPRGADTLTIWTTTAHLAERLGRAVHRAFRGRVHYEVSHKEGFADVTWRRD